MKFELVKVKDFFDVQWGDTNKTKSSYVSEGYLAYSASGPDGFLDTYDYDCDGVVLSAIGANCGVTYFAKGKWSCIKNTMRILPKPELSDATYFYYLSKTRNFWPKRGSAQPFISQTDVRELEIQLPSLGIQRAVGRALRQIDDKIAVNSAMSSNLEQIAQSIFKSWFVDFDPVHAKARGEQPEGMDADTAALFPDSFEDSELGPIPAEWRAQTVGNLLERIKVGATIRTLDGLPKGDTPIVQQGEPMIAGFTASANSVDANTDDPALVFGDHTCRMMLFAESFHPMPNTIVLRARDDFTYWGFYASKDLQQFESYRRHWMELERRQVVSPTYALKLCFEDVTKPIHKLIVSLRHQNKILDEIRDALLPVLLSGELEIPEELMGE